MGSPIPPGISAESLRNAFGVSDSGIALRFLEQLANVLYADAPQSLDEGKIADILAAVRAIAPVGGLEAMTATMLVAVQYAALDAMRRAAHPEQTYGGRQSYTSLALKAMRTHAQLLDAFNRGRGNGTTQQIIVKHLSIESGGQAIVGALAPGRGGDAKS